MTVADANRLTAAWAATLDRAGAAPIAGCTDSPEETR
jgi:hypothetical protein